MRVALAQRIQQLSDFGHFFALSRAACKTRMGDIVLRIEGKTRLIHEDHRGIFNWPDGTFAHELPSAFEVAVGHARHFTTPGPN
jgi:hypothetical protein